jgi:hypothetical protein
MESVSGIARNGCPECSGIRNKTQAALEKLSRNGWSYGDPSLLTLADQLDAMVDIAAEIF